MADSADIVTRLLDQRRRRQKMSMLFGVAAILVVILVALALSIKGVAMSSDNVLACGMEDHAHSDVCYEKVLVCEEPTEQTSGESSQQTPPHTHSDACYQRVLVCDKPEHSHTSSCYVDTNADVETTAEWESTVPEDLNGTWAEKLASVAKSQVGYAESTRNFTMAEDGSTKQGYTRYGQWYGSPYGQWDGMFVAFCLNYAGIDEAYIPREAGAHAWSNLLQGASIWTAKDGYAPSVGDMVFFDDVDGQHDGRADRAGIVSSVNSDAGTMKVIEGDSNNAVQENEYKIANDGILGYVDMDAVQALHPETLEQAADTAPPTDEAPAETSESSSLAPQAYTLRNDVALLADSDPEAGAPVPGTLDIGKRLKKVSLQYYEPYSDQWIDVADDAELSEETKVRFSLVFSIEPGALTDTDKLTYRLPDSFHLIEATSGQMRMGHDVVGDYVVNTDRTVTVTVSEGHVEENKEGMPITGTVFVEGVASNIGNKGNDTEEIKFSDTVTQVVHFKDRGEKSDLVVTKTATPNRDSNGKYNGTFTFEIEVRSENGTTDKVQLTDVLEGSDQVKLPNPINTDLTIIKPDGTEEQKPLTITPSGNSFNLELDQMKAGQTYKFSYTTSPIDGFNIDTFNGVLDETNKVNVRSTGTDGEGNTTTLKSEYEAKVKIDQQHLQKSGYTSNDGNIIWTIKVRGIDGGLDGYTLVDKDLPPGTKVTIKDDKSGSVLVQDMLISDTNGLSYGFKGGNEYTVTCVSPVTSLEPGNNDIFNTAELTKDKEDFKSTGQVDYPFNPLSKKGELDGDIQADGTQVVKWEVTINTAKGAIEAEYPYEDYLKNGQWMSDAQKQKLEQTLQDVMPKAGVKYEPPVWIEDNGKTVGFKINFPEGIDKDKKIVFEYSSTANVSQITGETQLSNTGKIGKAEVTTGPKVTPITPSVKKTDDTQVLNGSGESNNGEKTTHFIDNIIPSGNDNMKVLMWNIETTIPDKTEGNVTITEQLPGEGLALVQSDEKDSSGLQLRIDNGYEGYFKLIDQNGAMNFVCTNSSGYQNEVWPTATYSRDLNTVIMTFPDAFVRHFHGQKWSIKVRAQIDEEFLKSKDEAKWQHNNDQYGDIISHAFENHVTVETNTGSAEATQTQIVEKSSLSGKLDKSVLTKLNQNKVYEGNIVEYCIEVNKGAEDLNPDGDTLTLEDVLSTTNMKDARLLFDSLKVEEVRDDDFQPLTSDEYSWTYDSATEGGQAKNTLTLKIPDGKHLRITYKYAFEGQDNSASASNTAVLKYGNIHGGGSGSDVKIEKWDSGGTLVLEGITMKKVDADNYAKVLSGAKFDLYGYNETEKTWVKIKEVTAAEDGKLNMPNLAGAVSEASYKPDSERVQSPEDIPGFPFLDASNPALCPNVAYKLVETETPTGYESGTPYYFWLYDTRFRNSPYINPFDELWSISQSSKIHKIQWGSTAFVENERDLINNPGPTSIKVAKAWVDAEGSATKTPEGVDAVQFKLYQIAWDKPLLGEGKATLTGSAIDFVNSCGGFYTDGTRWSNSAHQVDIGSTVRISFVVQMNQGSTGTFEDAIKHIDPEIWENGVRLDIDIENEKTITDSNSTRFAVITLEDFIVTGDTQLSGNVKQWVTEFHVDTVADKPYSVKQVWSQPKLYRSESYTITQASNWETVIEGLPSVGTEKVNGEDKTVYYSYYVVEDDSDQYTLHSYFPSVGEENGVPFANRSKDVTKGAIYMLNIPQEQAFELPKTGGMGIWSFIVGGGAICLVAIALLLRQGQAFAKRYGKRQ